MQFGIVRPIAMTGFLIVLSLVFGGCLGMSSRANNEWPTFGYNLCGAIVYPPTRINCTACFTEAGNDWIAASQCVSNWLPDRFADCADSIRFIVAKDSAQNNGKNNRGSGNNGNGNAGNGNSGNGNAGNGNNGNGNSGNGNSGNSGSGGNGNANKFMACLNRAVNEQNKENKRAQTLFTKGGKYLQMVSDSKIIEGGGAAIFSCMAQDLLLNHDALENKVSETSGGCFGRFQMDPVNERWHIHKEDLQRSELSGKSRSKEIQKAKKSLSKKHLRSSNDYPTSRQIAYEYGLVGIDMPFHGVGPLAVDVLKGDCVFKAMDEYGSLDTLAEGILGTELPVAAWIFQELLDKITSVNLPPRAA